MTLVDAEIDDTGTFFFKAAACRADAETGTPLGAAELAAAIGDLLWYPDGIGAGPADDCVRPTDANLLMFLSDVRGRRFRTGVFLSDRVLAAVETFRAASRAVGDGRLVPCLERRGEDFYAVWRPLADGSPLFRRLADAIARRAGRSALEADARAATAEDAWLTALRSDSARLTYADADDGAVRAERRRELDDLHARLADWLSPLAVTAADRAALLFRLVPPATRTGTWRIFYDRPVTRTGYVSLGQAIRIFPPLGEDAFRLEDADAFVQRGAAALAQAGFRVELPAGLTRDALTAEADLTGGETPGAARPEPAAAARGNIRAHITVRVDGEVVSAAEIAFLLEQNATTVFFRNRWIEVDRNVLKEALRALKDADGQRLTLREAMAWLVGTRRAGGLKIAEARAHGWLRGLVNELSAGEGFRALPPPKGLRAQLRDYQRRGFSWLSFLGRWGFGACLADDMGLGKTLQTIAWILSRKEGARQAGKAPAAGPVLIVAPVSVVTNWAREFARFAPSLRVHVHQGATRLLGGSLGVACRRADAVVTGYSLLVRDFRDLQAVSFPALVLDEAQLVKNPDTRVAKAARALDAPVRIALTGTPLENSVRDLWSIEEFLNPGLLGARRDFVDTFGRDLAPGAAAGMREAAAARLRRALAPFMLRRLKGDPGIAAELGAKREVREYCALSAEQRRDYEDALRAFHDDRAADGDDARRRGRMLALLTSLKLICDGTGKLERLDALLEDIFAAGESALVFTQYVRVARAIREHLVETFGRRFPFLHGALAPAQRDAQIAAFNGAQEPAAFLISLRAGGFGLNLTRATHVIHFDRWWNPAVENQATDRAHRIGQTRTVFVHLFICSGTLEDRIDALLEEKRRLAHDVVASGEAFLAQMSAREFERTVALA